MIIFVPPDSRYSFRQYLQRHIGLFWWLRIISHRLTGIWSQTFEDRLLAVVEADAEAEDSVRLSTGELGVSNSSLSCCDSISKGCKTILLIYYILSVAELRLFNPWFQLLNLKI